MSITLTGTGITFNDGSIRTSMGAGEVNTIGCLAMVFYAATAPTLASASVATDYYPSLYVYLGNYTVSGSSIYYNVISTVSVNSPSSGRFLSFRDREAPFHNLYNVWGEGTTWNSGWGTQASGSWRFLTRASVSTGAGSPQASWWQDFLATRYA